ncbi:MAG TPA: 1-deoxy-D-xylulose-5-phosphate reductoisomerase [Tepidisphaeraceae bacterium]
MATTSTFIRGSVVGPAEIGKADKWRVSPRCRHKTPQSAAGIVVRLSTRVAILGSTGSIGTQAVEVLKHLGDSHCCTALSAHSRCDDLLQQTAALRPRVVAVTGKCDEAGIKERFAGQPCHVTFGHDALVDIVRRDDVDVVLSAVVGAAGLPAALATVEAGKPLLLANKESLVVAGSLLMPLARERQVDILPVDSEHSAIFQAMLAGRRDEVKRVILTASGGPFRDWPLDKMEQATPADALKHPTWDMGRKITIDSATMFNKAAELIEAVWLFDLQPEQIEVVVHPESVVHSMVEFVDGSVIAQLSPPDMRTPIQYALTYPKRRPGVSRTMDWTKALSLNFAPPDLEKFPALRLAMRVARERGTLGAVMNAANEMAVEAFLAEQIRFGAIWRTVADVMDQHAVVASPTLEQLLAADQWARATAAGLLAADKLGSKRRTSD